MATNISDINIPRSPFLDTSTNRPSREWLMYLLKLGNLPPFGSFFDTTTQTATANTATLITYNTTASSNAVSVSGTNKLVCSIQGLYNFQFSVQLENSSTSTDDVTIWIRKNGTDVDGSSGVISIPNSHGGIPGHTIQSWNYFVPMNAGDYVQFVWSTVLGTTSLKYYPAATGPTRPAAASIIVTVNQITP